MNRSIRILTAVFIFALGVCLVMAHPIKAAEGPKMAFVNISRIFDAYQKTQKYNTQLDEKYSEYEEERNKKIEEIRESEGRLSLLKESERKKLEAEIEEKKNALLEFDRAQQTDLRKERDEKIREILVEIENIINDFAKKEGYTLILNDRVLIYGEESLDITDKIIERLNK